ncbi:hypothetical protein ASC91_04535 [Pelomonas sp. Root1237]|nr:hypothetical protein ASC91_04535 [Pelomonas sp. Root1237]
MCAPRLGQGLHLRGAQRAAVDAGILQPAVEVRVLAVLRAAEPFLYRAAASVTWPTPGRQAAAQCRAEVRQAKTCEQSDRIANAQHQQISCLMGGCCGEK